MAHVFIGIGSSIDKLASIQQGIILLKKEFGELKISTVYESEAIGFTGNNFYNLVVKLESELTSRVLIGKLKSIEKKLGRAENLLKFAPRKLDLDLLLYDDLIDLDNDIPRAEIVKNAFVLQPLTELAAHLKHPILGKSYQQLWAEYPQQKQKLWAIQCLL